MGNKAIEVKGFIIKENYMNEIFVTDKEKEEIENATEELYRKVNPGNKVRINIEVDLENHQSSINEKDTEITFLKESIKEKNDEIKFLRSCLSKSK